MATQKLHNAVVGGKGFTGLMFSYIDAPSSLGMGCGENNGLHPNYGFSLVDVTGSFLMVAGY